MASHQVFAFATFVVVFSAAYAESLEVGTQHFGLRQLYQIRRGAFFPNFGFRIFCLDGDEICAHQHGRDGVFS